MFSYDIRIPKERIAVLIGKNGEMKRQLQEHTKCYLRVDSEEGDVTISGDDAVLLYTARQIIKAIARGFNPDIALRLLKQDWAFELIDLSFYSEKKNHQQRIKGRVIGQGGKSRKVIEDLTGASVSVYGKTVGIIAPIESLHVAKDAVELLLKGAMHSNVYRFLEKKQRDIRMARKIGVKTIE